MLIDAFRELDLDHHDRSIAHHLYYLPEVGLCVPLESTEAYD